MVRLKSAVYVATQNSAGTFQFLNGTIKINTQNLLTPPLPSFNSSMVRLKFVLSDGKTALYTVSIPQWYD